MYISSYWSPNPISTVQSEEPHVMDHLSNFTLIGWLTNREMQFYKNCANQKNWWRLAPRISSLAPGSTNPMLGSSYSSKIWKTTSFVNRNTMPLWYGAWRPNACRQAIPAPANLTPFTSTLISINFWLHMIRSQLLGLRFIPNTSHSRIHSHFPLRLLPL